MEVFHINNDIIDYISANLLPIGRFQTLLRESVKFSNFEKLVWSCDSASKLTPMQRFSDPYTLPVQ